ncbi:MFS transporter [Actinoallomurus soli]|nr:MFS transporter [Actinoallomurus soli]
MLTSAQGLGAIAGGLRVARLIARVGELTAIAIGLAAVGLGNGLYALPSLPVILIGLVITGVGQATTVVGFTTVIQRRTPGPLIGRVSTAAETLVTGPQTVSIAAGAALVSVVDYRLLLMIVTAGMLTAAAYLWPARRLSPGPSGGPPGRGRPSTGVTSPGRRWRGGRGRRGIAGTR